MTGQRTTDRSQERENAGSQATSLSRRLRERGQTTQDFAVGIGIFLLAVAFVFSFFPTVVTPFDSSVGDAETTQADRIADRIVYDLRMDTPNEIDGSRFQSEYAPESVDLAAKLGLRASSSEDLTYDRVNVTINDFDGDPVDDVSLTAGEVYTDRPAGSAARIVTVTGEPECAQGCRLVVRVW